MFIETGSERKMKQSEDQSQLLRLESHVLATETALTTNPEEVEEHSIHEKIDPKILAANLKLEQEQAFKKFKELGGTFYR